MKKLIKVAPIDLKICGNIITGSSSLRITILNFCTTSIDKVLVLKKFIEVKRDFFKREIFKRDFLKGKFLKGIFPL